MYNSNRTPLLFVGHGNPMNAISDNKYTREWEDMGKRINTPAAIVCMSAHWLTTGSFISSALSPKIIYDFYGFPEELYQVPYEVSGSPQLAHEVSQEFPEINLNSSWGIDHGAWSVLKKMCPKANVPVLQISIDYTAPIQDQIELMSKLRKLRERGILFVGSGNIVHNLQLAMSQDAAFDWALEFEDLAKKLISQGDLKALANYQNLGVAAKMAIPTSDHYRPMLNTLAMKYDDEEPEFFNQGIDLASVSMLSFVYTKHS